jgi:F0F1-type ATP synthase delta subunit
MLVFGVVEVRRLKRELETLNEFVSQAQIREPGKQPPIPRVSRLLEALATDNGLQLLQVDHRAQLKKFLAAVEKDAPNIHISFAIDPSSAFTAKMVTWMRANIHPLTLLEVGLQPTIAAGCVIRTPNKVFDFSLREHFADAEGLLMKALESTVTATANPTNNIAVTAAEVPAVTAAVQAETLATPVAAEAAAVPVPIAASPAPVAQAAIPVPAQAQVEVAAIVPIPVSAQAPAPASTPVEAPATDEAPAPPIVPIGAGTARPQEPTPGAAA